MLVLIISIFVRKGLMLLILCYNLFFKLSWAHIRIIPFVVALSLHDMIRCSLFSSRTRGKDANMGYTAVPFLALGKQCCVLTFESREA